MIKSCCVSLGNGVALVGRSREPAVYKTEDYGQSYTRIALPSVDLYDGINTLCVTSGGTVLAGTGGISSYGGRILRSTDAGETWTELADPGTPNSTTEIHQIIQRPNGTLLAGSSIQRYLFKSTDDGATWSIASQSSYQYVYSVLDAGSDVVLIGLNSGYYQRSTNGGTTLATATVMLSGQTGVVSLFKDSTSGAILGGLSPSGKVYRSTDNGVSFFLVQQLGSATSVNSFVQIPSGRIFASTTGEGEIFYSDDGGATWTLKHKRPFGESTVNQLVSMGDRKWIATVGKKGIPLYSTDDLTTFSASKFPLLDTSLLVQDAIFGGNALSSKIFLPLCRGVVSEETEIGPRTLSRSPNMVDVTFPGTLAGPISSTSVTDALSPAYFNGTTARINFINLIGSSQYGAGVQYYGASFWMYLAETPSSAMTVYGIGNNSTADYAQTVELNLSGASDVSITYKAKSQTENPALSVSHVFDTSPVERWVHVFVSTKYNTTNDGIMEIWVDGSLVASDYTKDFTYAYFQWTATPSYKDTIGCRCISTTFDQFYKGYLCLFNVFVGTMPFQENGSLAKTMYSIGSGQVPDRHSFTMKHTLFSAQNLRI